jgi:hypothetical protein
MRVQYPVDTEYMIEVLGVHQVALSR